MSSNPAQQVDLAHLRTWIGREETIDDIISVDLARKYHATFDFPGKPPKEGEIVPRLIHFCLAQPVVSTAQLGADGHPARGGFLPPVPLPRRMWAAGAFTFHDDLRVGNTIYRTSRILDVTLKEGRTGSLCFIKVQHNIQASGKLIIEEQQDIVYRGLDAPGGAAKSPSAVKPGKYSRPCAIGAPLLFRYSALTFNGHRIHYDRRYVVEEEGYPGLVVHGPLQAALLYHYASELRHAPPSHFTFRGLAPLFGDDALALHATETESSLEVWTAKANGSICVTGEARW